MFERCFIVASGNSLSEGISKGLWDLLKNEITFSINDNIRFFTPTVAMFGDATCYKSRYDYFSKHPLVVGRYACHFNHPEFQFPIQKDLILLQASGHYHGQDSLSKGIYSGILTGCFTLTLAICLGFKEIFLLGFDECEIKGKTHFYQDLEDAGYYQNWEGETITGVGKHENGEFKTSVYNESQKETNLRWKPFEKVTIPIWNVSTASKIEVFKKIPYSFIFHQFKYVQYEKINQTEVQNTIHTILQPHNKYRS